MNIVVLDAHPLDADGDLDWTPLRALGTLTLHARTAPAEVSARLGDADVVYTNKVRVGGAEFDAAPRLRLVSVLATGYDVIDTAAARAHNVTVCNVPGYSSPSTAQTTIALLLELCHHVGAHAQAVQGGAWRKANVWSFWNEAPVELAGKTLVIVGLGAVGRRVARIAKALDMNVVAAALPGRSNDNASLPPRRLLDEALEMADVVSLHCPLTPQTRGLLNAERIARLKPAALVINTARGPLVEEGALAEALQAGRLAGYAADVLSVEPPEADNPLLSAPRCLITPHFAWASRASRQRLLEASVANLRAFLAGAPQNVVSK